VSAIYGEVVKSAPDARDVQTLVEALNRAGNTDYTIIILPKIDHQFTRTTRLTKVMFRRFPRCRDTRQAMLVE